MRPSKYVILDTILKQIQANPAFYEALFASEFLYETAAEHRERTAREDQLSAFAYSPIWKILDLMIPYLQKADAEAATTAGFLGRMMLPSSAKPLIDTRGKLQQLKKLFRDAKKARSKEYVSIKSRLDMLLKRGAKGISYDPLGEKSLGALFLNAEENAVITQLMYFLYDNRADLELMAKYFKEYGSQPRQLVAWNAIKVRTDEANATQMTWHNYQGFRKVVAALERKFVALESSKMHEGYIAAMQQLNAEYFAELLKLIKYIQEYVATPGFRKPALDERFLGMFQELIQRLVEGVNKTVRDDSLEDVGAAVVSITTALAKTDQQTREAFIDYFSNDHALTDMGNGRFRLDLAANSGGTTGIVVKIQAGAQIISCSIQGIPFAYANNNSSTCTFELHGDHYEIGAANILAACIELKPKIDPALPIKTFTSGDVKGVVAFVPPNDFATAGVTFAVKAIGDNDENITAEVKVDNFGPFKTKPRMPEIFKRIPVKRPNQTISGYTYSCNLYKLLGIDPSYTVEIKGMQDVKVDAKGNLSFTHYLDDAEVANFSETAKRDMIENALICTVFPRAGESFAPTSVVLEFPNERLDAGLSLKPQFYFAIPKSRICEKLLSTTDAIAWKIATPEIAEKFISKDFDARTQPHDYIIGKACEAAEAINDYVLDGLADYDFDTLSLEDLKDTYRATIEKIKANKLAVAAAATPEEKMELLGDQALQITLAQRLLDRIQPQDPTFLAIATEPDKHLTKGR